LQYLESPCAAKIHAMKHPFQIAIVEDDLDLRLSTQEFLTAAGYRVWGGGDAGGVLRQFAAQPAQGVILDVGLPGEDGLSVTRLLQSNPQVAVIILSARDSLPDRLAGLQAGADRYLVKPIDLLELAANIDAVAARAGPKTPALAPDVEPQPQALLRLQDWELETRDWRLTAPAGKSLELTSREFRFIHKLVLSQGQTVQKRELIDELYGTRVVKADERLNVFLTRLRRKAQAALAEPLPIKTAHLVGYIFTAVCRLL